MNVKPVYDILNCGPRNRFAANGKIVSNCNPQNLTRGSKLRESIEAPAGHLLVVRDLSAIEARVNAWLSGQDDVVETYRRGEDVYCKMASVVFGRTITKNDKDQRFVGKTIILGCGYGLGWKKFQQMIRIGMLGDKGRIFGEDIAEALNVNVEGFIHRNMAYVRETLPPNTDEYTHARHCACAQQIIKTFRDNCPRIVSFWRECQDALDYIYAGEEMSLGKNGIVKTCKDGFLLPSGMLMRYVELDYTVAGRRKEYSILKDRKKGERTKVYGGLLVENLVQRLSRDIIAEHMLNIAQRYRIVMTTHDEIVCCVPESEAEAVYKRMGEIMSTPPVWAPDLPLASEGGFAKQYIK